MRVHDNATCEFCGFLKIWLRCGMAAFSLMFVVVFVLNLTVHDWLRAAASILFAANCAMVAWYAVWLVDKFNAGFDWLFNRIFGH